MKECVCVCVCVLACSHIFVSDPRAWVDAQTQDTAAGARGGDGCVAALPLLEGERGVGAQRWRGAALAQQEVDGGRVAWEHGRGQHQCHRTQHLLTTFDDRGCGRGCGCGCGHGCGRGCGGTRETGGAGVGLGGGVAFVGVCVGWGMFAGCSC